MEKEANTETQDKSASVNPEDRLSLVQQAVDSLHAHAQRERALSEQFQKGSTPYYIHFYLAKDSQDAAAQIQTILEDLRDKTKNISLDVGFRSRIF